YGHLHKICSRSSQQDQSTFQQVTLIGFKVEEEEEEEEEDEEEEEMEDDHMNVRRGTIEDLTLYTQSKEVQTQYGTIEDHTVYTQSKEVRTQYGTIDDYTLYTQSKEVQTQYGTIEDHTVYTQSKEEWTQYGTIEDHTVYTQSKEVQTQYGTIEDHTVYTQSKEERTQYGTIEDHTVYTQSKEERTQYGNPDHFFSHYLTGIYSEVPAPLPIHSGGLERSKTTSSGHEKDLLRILVIFCPFPSCQFTKGEATHTCRQNTPTELTCQTSSSGKRNVLQNLFENPNEGNFRDP
ncbi:hypothetical protein STEG23_012907, partial [Scotinomys teguina]